MTNTITTLQNTDNLLLRQVMAKVRQLDNASLKELEVWLADGANIKETAVKEKHNGNPSCLKSLLFIIAFCHFLGDLPDGICEREVRLKEFFLEVSFHDAQEIYILTAPVIWECSFT